MVVPDDVTHTQVPNVAGLLTYQTDTEVLRLRKTDSWKVVAEKELVSASRCISYNNVCIKKHRTSQFKITLHGAKRVKI